MHLVVKQVKGREYFYLVEKERRGNRVVTSRTVYVGDRQKLAELVQQSASAALPSSFEPQPVGAVLARRAREPWLGPGPLDDRANSQRAGD
jgi:hypothetical protein